MKRRAASEKPGDIPIKFHVNSFNSVTLTGRIRDIASNGLDGDELLFQGRIETITRFERLNGQTVDEKYVFSIWIWQAHCRGDISSLKTGVIVRLEGEIKNQPVQGAWGWTRKKYIFVNKLDILGHFDAMLLPEPSNAQVYE